MKNLILCSFYALVGVRFAQAAPYTHVITPGIATLDWELIDGVKVFKLTAEPVDIQFPDGADPMMQKKRLVKAWGYNGSVIGPTIEAVEGDRVQIIVTNHLPEPTTVHWHGLTLPIEMDGVAGITQDPIPPGGVFNYEFTLKQSGTYFYHPHYMAAKQAGMGMAGIFIIHPKNPEPWYKVDKDYAYFLQMWMLHPGSPVPDTMEMTDFNYFTMNGRPGPMIVPMEAKSGEKVRIRVMNLSMMSHPIHLHGHTFQISEYGAGFIKPDIRIPANTTNISSAEERSLEFVAGSPGTWVFHCHFLHHTMNDMHRPPIPGQTMTDMGMDMSMMDMGGMHTFIKVTP